MGKVVKFTGGRLLGEELRRMRAGRSLDEIVALGKAKLAAHGFKAISKASLSEIENGRTLPGVESLFALAVLYQLPASRFLHFLLEENLVDGLPSRADEAEIVAAHAAAVTERRWPEALGLCVQAERCCVDGWPQIRWRLNRCIAMEKLGMRQDALVEMGACLESPELPSAERVKVHREMARMHCASGNLNQASLHAREAMDLAATESDPRLAFALVHARVYIALTQIEELRGTAADRARELDAVESWVREARLLAVDVDAQLSLDHAAAHSTALRRDTKRAKQAYSALLARSREEKLPFREVEALIALGGLESDERPEVARRHYARAAEMAVDGGHLDQAFFATFRLLQLAQGSEQHAHFHRRCQKLYPFVSGRTRAVREFEQMRENEVQ